MTDRDERIQPDVPGDSNGRIQRYPQPGPQPAPVDRPETPPVQRPRRFKVLGIGLALGALFSAWVAVQMTPSNWGIASRAEVWAIVMGGPVVGTSWGMTEFHTSVAVGWLGLPLVPAHPFRPNAATGCLTILGLALWFFAGFATMAVAMS
jgi:hypothetical protein